MIVDHLINPLHNPLVRCKFLQNFFLLRIFDALLSFWPYIGLPELSCWWFRWRLVLLCKYGCWLPIIILTAVIKLVSSWCWYTLLGRRMKFICLYPIVYLLFPSESLVRVGWHYRGVIRTYLALTLWYLQWILWYGMRLLWEVGRQRWRIVTPASS